MADEEGGGGGGRGGGEGALICRYTAGQVTLSAANIGISFNTGILDTRSLPENI